MTEVSGYDPELNTFVNHQVLHSSMDNNTKSESITERWSRIEKKAVEDMTASGIKVLSVKTEFITKRRYKRIKAKKMIKLAKTLGYN